MQDLTPRLDANAQLIQSYGPAGFRIANVDYAGSVFVSAEHTAPWDGILSVEALAPIFAMEPPPEVLLIGTGMLHRQLPVTLREALKIRAIPADVMATGAAARTFNILLGEARRVVALLMVTA